eukprot:TRINITY_DN68197_c0_g1_i1.p1 TRINITY_DN68197_c0_g1~~TRINITY_DN68197_c0_g1_i1.p1  ORF type:complete len:459 (-),score=70.16 TRINITY_DN68197_c0_g1_i1:415-1791(-)
MEAEPQGANSGERGTFSPAAASSSSEALRIFGRWVDEYACSAICLLILNDLRSCISATPNCELRRSRPPLPSCLYIEQVTSFLRFAAPLPNMLYAIGGRNRLSGPVDAVEMLDTWHGTWVRCAPMPGRRAGCAAAALPDGRLLVAGGYNEHGIARGLVASCDMYDPYAENWLEGGVAPLQRARWGHGCATLGRRVYAVGGCSLQPDAHPQEMLMTTLRSCEVYEPSLDRWDWSAPLQIARSGCRVVALACGQRLAAVGGCDDVFGRVLEQATVEVFDETSGHWELLRSRLSRPRTSAAVAAIDDKRLFVAGGAPSQRSVEIFNMPASHEPPLVLGTFGFGRSPQVNGGAKSLDSQEYADMVEGRMGCHAAVVRLPGKGKAFPVCDTKCVLVVGGERCDDTSNNVEFPFVRVRQLCSVAVYDLVAEAWREETALPPMAVPRTTAALCLGFGRVSCARLA